MNQPFTNLKPLFLSEDEALALLDLCLLSRAEMQPVTECALAKLTNLARQFVAEEIETEKAAKIQHEPRQQSPTPPAEAWEVAVTQDGPEGEEPDRAAPRAEIIPIRVRHRAVVAAVLEWTPTASRLVN